MKKRKNVGAADLDSAIRKSGLPLRVFGAGIVALGLIAYSNSFQGPFIFDDLEFIQPSAHRLPWPPLHAIGLLPSRPLIGLSFALNYMISGTDVWSYHALNLLVHLLAALALFGVVRRTLLSDRLRDRFGKAANALAFTVAVIWVVHPLTTQSVTYIIQRCESMMGLFYFTTLYCAIRAFGSANRAGWFAASISACAAGVLSKEVIVTAPLMVLLYDVVFVSHSFRESLRVRWPFYSGLAATWILLAAAGIAAPVNETAGFSTRGMTAWVYFRSEPAVILHYLRLSVWPDSLVLDYAWPAADTAAQIVPYVAIVGSLFAVTLAALIRLKPIGFVGAWFFFILSVTSSFMPFSDLAFEHRVYVPLAGVITFLVLGGYFLGKRLIDRLASPNRRASLERIGALVSITAIVSVFAVATLRRNVDYQNDLVMWTDVVSKRPENGRAQTNLGLALAQREHLEEALEHFYLSYQYTPANAKNRHNLGLTLFLLGRVDEAKPHLIESLRLKPTFSTAHYNLGRVLVAQGEVNEGLSEFSSAVSLDPAEPEPYFEIGRVRERQGRLEDAVENYSTALRLRPDWPEAMGRLSVVLSQDSSLRDLTRAGQLADKAVSLAAGQSADALDGLASVSAATGRYSDAVAAAQKAIALASDSGDASLKNEIEAKLRVFRESAAGVKQ